MIVGVLVQISSKSIDKVFDYFVPPEFENNIKVGIRVEVPFGKQVVEGFVLEIKKESNLNLRDIKRIIDNDIILNDELLALGKIMQEKTLSTLISCYQTMLPKALKAKEGKKINVKYDVYYYINNNDFIYDKLNVSQKKIIDICKQKGKVIKKELDDISSSSLKTLLKNNILVEESVEHYRIDYSKSNSYLKKELSLEQKNAVTSIISNLNYNINLLYGVTGSGKTEVYMEVIDYVLSLNKTAIVLVPEISLTPQMVSRFQSRFGNKIAALHSALSDGEKYDEWRRISLGEASIVIGARSAIFAPLKNIGVIIVDEEHSESYKQSDMNPKYNAKEIAIIRAKYYNCPVVFGSATPTLESMARAQKGVYNLLEMPSRINGMSMPIVHLVDMNKNIKKLQGHFTNDLIFAIKERINKKEQVILFLNRRGYSSVVSCRNCGYTFKCPNCDISLTYHKSSNTLRCHYCGYGTKVYDKCPECGEEALSNLGIGTEKIEEELHNIFPECNILRMDVDTTTRKGSHEKMLNDFRNHKYDILLGTQIVAKGLDFSNVTLVGVINADTGLNIPDFRSSENTFSLLSQVAGRCGRGDKKGEVFVQTFNPDHYAIKFAEKYDYNGFYLEEMKVRKILKYPPYYYLVYIRISGKDVNYIFSEANKIKRSLDRNLKNVIILGPSQCTMFRVNNIYKYGIILKYKKCDNLYIFINQILEHYKSNIKISIDVDFNPSKIY